MFLPIYITILKKKFSVVPALKIYNCYIYILLLRCVVMSVCRQLFPTSTSKQQKQHFDMVDGFFKKERSFGGRAFLRPIQKTLPPSPPPPKRRPSTYLPPKPLMPTYWDPYPNVGVGINYAVPTNLTDKQRQTIADVHNLAPVIYFSGFDLINCSIKYD